VLGADGIANTASEADSGTHLESAVWQDLQLLFSFGFGAMVVWSCEVFKTEDAATISGMGKRWELYPLLN